MTLNNYLVPSQTEVPTEVNATTRPAGHVVVEQLVEYGVSKVFAVPGESYLAVLDGLYEHRESIDLITARQEGGAAMMAAAYGRITGRVGVCMVTRGPGATNASIGVHVASQDASPMVLFIGQVPAQNRSRRAFQEVDYTAMFGSMAKQVIEIHEAERVPELVSRALALAVSGEPGPVVVTLPEDMLIEPISAPAVKSADTARPIPAPSQIGQVQALISGAERPVIIAGRCNWTADVGPALASFAEKSKIPLVTAVRCQDLIDNRSAAYAGTLGLETTPGLASLVETADLVVLLGTRPDALTMGDYSLLTPPRAAATIIHVYPDPDAFGQVYVSDISLPVSPREFVDSLPASIQPSAEREQWFQKMRQPLLQQEPVNKNDAIAHDFMEVFNRIMPANTITTSGAGAYTAWQQRHRRFVEYPSQVGTQSGSMGYGLPAAIAAAVAFPGRTVAAFAGDGCFMMTGQELATAAAEELDILLVIVNNSRYGVIRDHQDRHYPGRVSGTDLHNPQFVELAQSFGAKAASVDSPEDFGTALKDLARCKGLRVIEVKIP